MQLGSFFFLIDISHIIKFTCTCSVVRDMIALERALDESLDRLKKRMQEVRPEADMSEEALDDELDSVASSTMNGLNALHHATRTVRFGPTSRDVEILKKKLSLLENENLALRNEIARLKSCMSTPYPRMRK